MSEKSNEVKQVLCKPVGNVSGDVVNTLSLYVSKAGNPAREVLYFMPRYSLKQNREFLENLYPVYCKEHELEEGKGFCCHLYKVEKVYRGVSTANPNNEELKGNLHHWAAYQTWGELYPEDRDLEEDVYILSPVCKFSQPKFTVGQHNVNLSYYTLKEILTCGSELPAKGEE